MRTTTSYKKTRREEKERYDDTEIITHPSVCLMKRTNEKKGETKAQHTIHTSRDPYRKIRTSEDRKVKEYGEQEALLFSKSKLERNCKIHSLSSL